MVIFNYIYNNQLLLVYLLESTFHQIISKFPMWIMLCLAEGGPSFGGH